MKFALFGIVALVALYAAVAAPTTTTCVTRDGCTFGLPQTVCESADPANVWHPPGSGPDVGDPECTTGCCSYTSQQSEQITQAACSANGGSWAAGTCGSQSNFCAEGQTDCICAGVAITTGQWCCSNQISTTQCSTGGPGPGPGPGTSTCGDGNVDSFEQCDPGDPNDPNDDNMGSCTAAPAGHTQSCTLACRCSYNAGDYDPNDGLCSPGEPCSQGQLCSSSLPDPTAHVTSVPGQSLADVTWSLTVPTACTGSLQGFSVKYEVQGAQGFVGGLSVAASARQATFTVVAGTSYNVQVGALWVGGNVTWSPIVSFTAGAPECFVGKTEYCTDTQQLVRCSGNNTATNVVCSATESCYPTVEGGAACLPTTECDFCNGGYDSFAEVRGAETQSLTVGSNTFNIACAALANVPISIDTSGATITATFCYLNGGPSALYQYDSCAETRGCLDYTLQSSCPANPCGLPGQCAWVPGIDLCTNTDEEFQECDRAISQQECSAIGTACFWQNNVCTHKRDVVCENYDQTSCGTRDFALNPNTNIATATSNDLFNLGKCKFTTHCHKDANDDGRPDPLLTANDFTNPTTTLLVDPTTQTWGDTISIPYIVSEPSITYAELLPGNCGPVSRPPQASKANVDPANGLIAFTGLTTGNYCLQYYSQDLGNNLEHVQQTQIAVDAAQLQLTYLDVIITPWPSTQTSTVDIEWGMTKAATCTAGIQNVDGLLPRGYAIGFDLVYRDLADGQYIFEIDCVDASTGSSIQNVTTLALDFDTRITSPIPSLGTYTNSNLAVFGVHTLGQATCTYLQGGQQPLPNQRNVQLNGQQHVEHTATAGNLATGYYSFPVECTFPGNIVLPGGAADVITFAIDEQAPQTLVVFNNQTIGGTVPVDTNGGILTITCQDGSISGNNQQWEAGCDQTFIGLNGATPTPLAGSSYTIQLGDQITIYSVDKLGNQESPRTISASNVDISGPERPAFSVVKI